MAFIAGQYLVTYGGNSLGQIEDGIELEYTFSDEDIRGDNLGDSIQDAVIRGGDCFANFTMLEWNAAGALAAFWPIAAVFGKIGRVGRLKTSLSAALVLTAVAGTTAAGTPATLSASRAVLPRGFPVRQLFAPRLRRVPMRMQFLPYSYSAEDYWFQTA